MPWYYNEKTGLKIDVEAGSILEEIVEGDPNFHALEDMPTEEAEEATEEATEEAEDLAGLSKEELIHMATLMGVPVRSKDTVAQLRAKIEASKEVK